MMRFAFATRKSTSAGTCLVKVALRIDSFINFWGEAAAQLDRVAEPVGHLGQNSLPRENRSMYRY